MAGSRLKSVIQQLCQAAGARSDSGASDGNLLGRFVASRDEATFELLVWRHQRMVLNVCQRVLRDPHDAEDAFQATFLTLARKASSIGRREALSSWLYQVAYRIALKASARRGQRNQLERQGVDLSAAAGPDGESTAIVWRDLEPLLDQELNHLPEKYRAPVVLCYLEGKSYDEAAEQLGWAKGTVSTRLTHARDLLRKRLVQRGLALSAATFATVLVEQSASAAVPAALVSSSVKGAVLYAAGNPQVAGLVAPEVVALAEEALRGLFLAKLKMLAIVAITIGIVGTGLGGVTYWALAKPAAAPVVAEEPRPTPARPKEPSPDQVPDGLRNFSGTLIGRLVVKQPDRGSLLLEVRQVKNVSNVSKAPNPQSAVGKTLQIDGVFGRFVTTLAAMQPGDGVQIEAGHTKGVHLTFLGEELSKVPLPAASK